jgi:hypothetical protein
VSIRQESYVALRPVVFSQSKAVIHSLVEPSLGIYLLADGTLLFHANLPVMSFVEM